MRFHKSLIALLLCLSLFVVVSAHPGKTDYKGGHIDHSAEEYHYHHGYSAHQHYDMDGDGDLDCPYLFDDKTESSKKHSGSYTIKNKSPSDNKDSSQNDAETPVINNESQKETTKKRTALDYVKIICCLVLAFSFLKGFLQLAIDEIKKRLKK